MILVSKRQSEYNILIESQADEVESFAAFQLQYYIQKMSGARIPITSRYVKNRGKYIFVGKIDSRIIKSTKDQIDKLNPDGFIVKNIGNNLVLTGSNDRGTLYSVYGFLEYLGIRWIMPGSEGEIIPKRETIQFPFVNLQQEPCFKWRSFDFSGHMFPFKDENMTKGWIAEARTFIDWMAKNKMSNLFPSHVPPEVIRELLPELKRRAITLECGGHTLPDFLPKTYFEKHPEYFRFFQGKRRSDRNFCGSNQKGLDIVKENAVRYVKDYEGCNIFHFWGYDALDNSWCECEKCKDLNSAEQALNVINRIAEKLIEIKPSITLSLLSYHETLQRAEKVIPRENILLFLALRQRCYAHPINSPDCQRNKRHRFYLEKWLEIFDKKMCPFEYYHDAVLFNSMTVPLVKVISQDLRYYKDIGIDKVESLVFTGSYAWWAYSLSLYAFSKMCWDVEISPEDILRDFCKSYGQASDLMQKYYLKLEEAMNKVLTLCGYKEEELPNLGVGVKGKPPFLKKHLKGIEQSSELFSRCEDFLKKADEIVDDYEVKQNIKKIQTLLLYTKNEVEVIYHKLRGEYDNKIISLLKKKVAYMNEIPEDVKGVYGKDRFNTVYNKTIRLIQLASQSNKTQD